MRGVETREDGQAMATSITQQTQSWTDEEVVRRILDGDTALFEIIMRRYNQRLYRVAVSILRNDAEAEDVMQDAYVRAYQHLGQFEGRARFSTWLTRITVHEALARMHRQYRQQSIDMASEMNNESTHELVSSAPSPEQQASSSELTGLLERAILHLPEGYRSVLVMRDLQGMDTSETAECLDTSEENVKVRLHRARKMLRRELYVSMGATSTAAFQFLGPRCDRIVENVLRRIAVPN
jgi:RNA polymerase sigma-70 factor, ECF subfamily